MKHLPLLLALGALACSRGPRPGVLDQVDRARAGAAVAAARDLAPQATLVAEKHRRDALAALDEGDRAGAQLLGERALAAFETAHAAARLVAAREREGRAARERAQVEAELAQVSGELARVAAEAEALELRARVERDALPLGPSEPASPERERARRAAALALSTDARLLCVSAQLLGPDPPARTALLAALDALDLTLAASPPRPPIDEARRLRSACLAELTEARAVLGGDAPESERVDALLDQLGREAQEPFRDDRGVVVSLRGAFRGPGLAQPALARLASLGAAARAHPAFPLLVVAHGSKSRATDLGRAEAAARALREGGAPRVEVAAAGTSRPLLPASQSGAAAANERLEVVFVAPEP